ncbi:hypothetical protein LCGC14_2858620 [marine sediment metagenome]|uniref:Ribbon-helix-helix protein CopG domain-containing protein n=1 Tax=marine sediment metagenome TaxID=412755 RepID=A0A0F9AXA4_9ZZZZ
MGRNNELKLKLSREERNKIEQKAKELGLKLSTYIRMVSLKANTEVKNIK